MAVILRPLQLGISLAAYSRAESAFDVGFARQAGFDVVVVIDRTAEETERVWDGEGGDPLMAAEGNLAIEASHEMLRMVTKSVTTVAVSPLLGDEAAVADRVRYVRHQLDPLTEKVQLAFSFLQVSLDDPTDLSVLRQLAPSAVECQLHQMATLLDGSLITARDRIRRFHDLGISYFTFHKSAATSWNTLAALVAAVR
jgi:hypothetical protein